MAYCHKSIDHISGKKYLKSINKQISKNLKRDLKFGNKNSLIPKPYYNDLHGADMLRIYSDQTSNVQFKDRNNDTILPRIDCIKKFNEFDGKKNIKHSI